MTQSNYSMITLIRSKPLRKTGSTNKKVQNIKNIFVEMCFSTTKKEFQKVTFFDFQTRGFKSTVETVIKRFQKSIPIFSSKLARFLRRIFFLVRAERCNFQQLLTKNQRIEVLLFYKNFFLILQRIQNAKLPLTASRIEDTQSRYNPLNN